MRTHLAALAVLVSAAALAATPSRDAKSIQFDMGCNNHVLMTLKECTPHSFKAWRLESLVLSAYEPVFRVFYPGVEFKYLVFKSCVHFSP